jgi:epoxyqueuosine reductase QueG
VENSAKISGDWIKNLIRDFITTSPYNTMGNKTGEPAWDDALVGFASGADSIWQQYKEYVGAFHWTPWEVFNQHCSEESAGAEELTVVSWVLPQRDVVRKANRRAKKYPSEEWARIRVYGEEFNVALRRHVSESLKQVGHVSIAPILASNWTRVNSERFSYASSWSERHAAHAAGLGTFGLCDGLITAKGKALRVGSVVAKISIQPTPRPYSDHRSYCLFFAKGTCGKCIDRCPVRAITESGHDKNKCRQHVRQSKAYVRKTYKFEGYGCGLCQVGVPCEADIPVKSARKNSYTGPNPKS